MALGIRTTDIINKKVQAGEREKKLLITLRTHSSKSRICTSANKRSQAAGSSGKKMSFKSFDHRRALTKLENREESFDDPASYLYSNPVRSSSAWHKKNNSNERSSSGHKKSTKASVKSAVDYKYMKPASHRHKQKAKNKGSNMKRVSATQAMINLIKSSKHK